jgi:hypothetical protein
MSSKQELPSHLVAKVISHIPDRKKEKAVAMNMVSHSIRSEFTQTVRENAVMKQIRKAWKQTWLELFDLLQEKRIPLAIKLQGFTLNVTSTDRDLYDRTLNPETTYLRADFPIRANEPLGFYKALTQKAVKVRPNELVNANKHILVAITWPTNPPKYRIYRVTFSDLAESLMMYHDPGSAGFKLLDSAGLIDHITKQEIVNILDRLEKHTIDFATIGSYDIDGGSGSHTTHTYKGHSYKVHIGSRGGTYIMVDNKKVYV